MNKFNAQFRGLERLFGRKTLENENLKEVIEVAQKKVAVVRTVTAADIFNDKVLPFFEIQSAICYGFYLTAVQNTVASPMSMTSSHFWQ